MGKRERQQLKRKPKVHKKLMEKKKNERVTISNFKRREKSLKFHLNNMGAAYSKTTDIEPQRAALVYESDQVKKPDGTIKFQTRYWYEHHEDRAKLIDAHPDILHMFELMMALSDAYETKNNTEVKEGFEMVKEFRLKYDKELNDEAKTEVQP